MLADQPVSALDLTVRRTISELLDTVAGENTLIFVSHDLNVVRELCSTIAVICGGRIVEQGATEDVWKNPQHSYTRSLLG